MFSLCAHMLACVVPVWKHGTESQKQRWLGGLCRGEMVGAHAITEPDSGSDTFAMRLRAERDGAGWRLSGSKTFISNGPEADLVVVVAITDADKRFHGGVTGFIIERGTPGFSAGQRFARMGLRTSPVGELTFDGAYVADDAVLGPNPQAIWPGDRQVPGRLSQGGRYQGPARSGTAATA